MTEDARIRTLALPSTVLAAASARRFLEGIAADLGPVQLADLLLMTTELVSNAVRYGDAPIRLVADRSHAGVIRIEVCNGGVPDQPVSAPDLEAGSEGGRGLHIVAALSRSWAVDSSVGQTCAWFELSL